MQTPCHEGPRSAWPPLALVYSFSSCTQSLMGSLWAEQLALWLVGRVDDTGWVTRLCGECSAIGWNSCWGKNVEEWVGVANPAAKLICDCSLALLSEKNVP